MDDPDAPLDIRTLTKENIDELAKLTGRATEALWDLYFNAHPKPVNILVDLERKKEA